MWINCVIVIKLSENINESYYEYSNKINKSSSLLTNLS
jgi:hypothetical protein